jgi:hypothetical protein
MGFKGVQTQFLALPQNQALSTDFISYHHTEHNGFIILDTCVHQNMQQQLWCTGQQCKKDVVCLFHDETATVFLCNVVPQPAN